MFPLFMKNFEINVESKEEHDSDRLSYLIQFCKGKAKEAIEHCIIMPPEEGYKRAKDILRKNFGRTHIVSKAFLDKQQSQRDQADTSDDQATQHGPSIPTPAVKGSTTTSSPSAAWSKQTKDTAHCSALQTDLHRVSLKVVPVKVTARDSKRVIETYAFLDDGSNTTMCLRSLAEDLGVEGKPVEFVLSTMTGNQQRSGQQLSLDIVGIATGKGLRLEKVWTTDRLPITEESILTKNELSSWPHLKDVHMAEIPNKEITILIGSDAAEALCPLEVKSVLKKNDVDPEVLKNYRPISNLPFLGKVIERIVAMQLKHYLVTNDLYTITQSAYRANHSTETAMLRVSNDINLALDNHNDVVLVMLDLSSAFDTIDHKALKFANIDDCKKVFWVDSLTVLSWIRNSPRNFKPFVSARVAEIQETMEVQNFAYIKSKDNPADALTRGINSSQLADWMGGPSFLKRPEDKWSDFEEEASESEIDVDRAREDEVIKEMKTSITGSPTIAFEANKIQ
ncbi:hypothetical protein QZH41_019097 [Actinostola sp. cb2023]|nr:hypothetical protein QZH41_019097 [Actinostola sp. cb2023]